MYLKNLKLLRNEKELTQDDIAKYLGVSRTTYNNWEQGTVLLPLDIADKLSAYYKVRLSCILGIDNNIEYKDKINKMNYDVLLKNINELKINNKNTYEEIGTYLKCTRASCQRYFNGIIKIPIDRLILLSELYDTDLDKMCGK